MTKSIDKSHLWKGTLVDTGKRVELPVPFSYEFLIGGACRDTLLGVPPNDYDFYFSRHDIFKEAAAELGMQGFKCNESEEVVKDNFVKTWLRFRQKHWLEKDLIYDLFLCHDFKDIETTLNTTADFTINACYQCPGQSINITKEGFECLGEKVLVTNTSNRPFGDILYRALKFKQEYGFMVGTELATKLIENCETHLTKSYHPNGDFAQSMSEREFGDEYIHYSAPDYGVIYVSVRRHRLFRDLLDVLGEEHLFMVLSSSHEYFVTLAKKRFDQLQKQKQKQEQKQEDNKHGKWFRRFFMPMIKNKDA